MHGIEGLELMDRLRNFGFLLHETSRRYVHRFEQRANQISMTLPQCRVLAYLARNEGVSQSRLAELTDLEPMAMVRILDRMEADGLVERQPDPADRRARSLYLTPKAKPALDEIWRIGDLTRAETFAGIGREEREMFIDALTRVVGNLRALEDIPVSGDGSRSGAPPVAETAPARRRVRKLPVG